MIASGVLDAHEDLGRALQAIVAARGGYPAFTFLPDGERIGVSWTYSELHFHARSIGRRIAETVDRGARVLIAAAPGTTFLTAFLGAVYAGTVPVPVPVPRFQAQVERTALIVQDAQASAIIAASQAVAALQCSIPVLDPGKTPDPGAWTPDPLHAEDLAFLQYTSGSTGTPRGVMVSHRNLIANSALIGRRFTYGPDCTGVTWLPPSHDMGLIEGLLQPLLNGAHCIVMPPEAFLRRPRRWLQAISTFGVTHSGAPDFAYALCTQRLSDDDCAGLDLSTWRIAYLGAEPIQPATMRDFAARFGRRGFSQQAFRACYGLAEATLLVSEGPLQTLTVDAEELAQDRVVSTSPDHPHARELAACGFPDPSIAVRVVDVQTGRESAEGRVGEICLAGPSITQGYWLAPEATRQAFGESSAQPRWLRTGDLGFVVAERLVITGRLKDLIILNGRNLYPQDVERAARNAHPAIRRMPVALGTYGQAAETRDRLVVMCEVNRQSPEEMREVAHAIRRSVSECIEVEPSAVVLLPPASVRYTTSGKVMRSDLRARFLSSQLEILFEWHRPAGDPGGDGVRELILSRLASGYSEDDRLADLGADSLFTQELAHALEIRHGVSVRSADLLRMTVAQACQLARNAPPSANDDHQPRGATVLTRAQQGLLFIHRLWGRRDPFVMSCAMQLSSSVELGRLAAALARLIGRHAILSARFVEVGTEAGGWSIAESTPPVLEEYPHGSLGDFLGGPLDLTSGPPIRLGLFTGPDSPRLLVLRAHHVALDFWSLRVLLRELAALYASRDASLPPSPDTAVAGRLEAGDLASEQGARVHEHWRARLTDAPLYFELPLDRPRPRVPSFGGGRVLGWVEPQSVQRAQVVARNCGVSITAVMFAAFVALCGRYSGKRDVLLGTLVSGRSSSALAGHVGMMARVVPVRVDLSDELDGVSLLQRTETALYEAQTLQPVALDLLLQSLRATDHDTTAVPRILFNFLPTSEETEQALAALANNIPGKLLRLGELELQSAALPPDAAFHDLILHVFRDGAGLRLVAHYATELFDAERMQRLLEHYANLLEALVCNPACALWDRPLMGQAEIQQLLSVCAADDRRAPDETLHDLVSAQARRTPAAIALTAGDLTLTYEELELAAGRMAVHLRHTGVGPGDSVAIHLPRDIRLPVAMLAVLKTGAAYVPLDPAYPPERLRMMLADSGARLVISASQPIAFAQPQDTFVAQIARDGPVLEAQRVGSDWPAYVLFTSGSTGRPKGVVIAHRSAAALATWAGTQFGAALRRVFASTSASFDLSVFEIFGTLAYGGTVILAPDLLSLVEMGTQCRPTLLSGVPSVLAALHERRSLPAVEALAVAGEPLSTELADRLLMTGTGTRVFDLYGPTEVTTYATGCERAVGAPASIGRPLPYTRLYLLDSALGLVPAGIPGEIFLGGDRLARGYIGQPALTADRFLPDPFSSRPGAVMYRTGDLGCLRADGNLKYLGRIDRQIKLRGFRIELEEIEQVIRAHPAVREVAVVLIPGKGASSEQLVAWVAPNATSLAGELREFAAARLPGFMLPSAFVCVDNLPRTPNGKLDRDELASRAVHAPPQAEACGPANPRTVECAALMAQVLGRVGLEYDADFFSHGGHSLAVLELCRQIRLRLQLDVPVRLVFEAPTPRLLAQRLGAGPLLDDASSKALPAPPTQSCEPDFPELNFAQRQLWYEYQADPTSAAYNLAVLVNFSRPVRSDCVAGALGDITAAHPVLRSRLSTGMPPSWIALEQEAGGMPGADLLVLEREDAAFADAAQALVATPFRLSREAPLRACLLRSLQERCALVLCVHHIAVDGISLSLLIRQLLQAIVAREEGRLTRVDAAGLPPGARVDLETGSREAGRKYWGRALAGARPTRVPPDEPVPVAPPGAGGLYCFDIPADLHARMLELVAQRTVTPFMLVLTGFVAVLARMVGRHDIVIGMTVSLRQHLQADDRIGMFVQPVLLRFRLLSQTSFQDLLGQVREVVLDALAHASVPFEEVLATAKPMRHSPAEAFYSILFSAQDVLEQHVEVPELTVHCHSVATGAARADFTVLLQLGPGEARCGVEYRRSLYKEESVSAVCRAWMQLLSEGMLEPDTPVGVSPSASPLEHEVHTEVAARSMTPWRDSDGSIWNIAADAWRELLGEAPSPGSSFFEVGGNSLLAVRLLARLEAATGQVLALKDFLVRPTLQGLVESVWRARSSCGIPRLPPLQVRPEHGSPASTGCVLSAAQKQVLLFQQLSPDVAAYNVGCALRYTGALSRSLLEQAFRTLVERHPALRTRVGTVDNRPVQVIEPKADFGLELIELAHQAADRVAAARRAAEGFQARQFDLARAPLFRAALIPISPEDHVLVIVAHHIVSDAFSLELLLHELGGVYGGRTLGAPVAASPADFALWEESWIRTTPALVAAAHWQDRLRGLTGAPVLPFRGGAGAGACTVTRQIGAQTRDRLRALAGRTGATLFHVLLTGYLWLLNRVSQRAELVIGLPVTTRREWSLERAVGFFSNTVPLRVDCAFALDAQSLVAHVRDAVVDAHEWGWLPLPQILEAWQPPRDPNRPHFFETLFVIQDGLPTGLFPGPISRFQTDLGAARCEVLLSIINDADGLCVQLQVAGGERVSTAAQFLGTALESILEQLALGVLAPEPVVLPVDALEPARGIDWTDAAPYAATTSSGAGRLLWQRAPAPLQFRPEPRNVLVYADSEAVRQGLARSLRKRGIRCILASPGRTFAQLEEDHFTLRPELIEDHQRLWSALKRRPGLVIHAAEGCVGQGESLPQQQWQEQLLTPLSVFSQALGQAPDVELVVMTRGAQLTAFDSRNDLGQAALGWLAASLADRKGLRFVRTIDLGLQRHIDDEESWVLEAITCGADREVALRGSLRLVKRLVLLPTLDSPSRMQGHWLIMGESAESLSSDLRRQPGLQVTAIDGALGRIDLDLLPQTISTAEQRRGRLSGICWIDPVSAREDKDVSAPLFERLRVAERLAGVLGGRTAASLLWLSPEPPAQAGTGTYTSATAVVANYFRSVAGQELTSCFIRCQPGAGGRSSIEPLQYLDMAGAWAYVGGVDLLVQGSGSMEKQQGAEASRAASTGAGAPAGAIESAVADVWSELLSREDIPRDVPFFALGGSSVDLPAMKLRLDGLFKRDIPPHVFFSAPTVARLAQWLQGEPTGQVVAQIPETRRRPRWRLRTRTVRPE